MYIPTRHPKAPPKNEIKNRRDSFIRYFPSIALFLSTKTNTKHNMLSANIMNNANLKLTGYYIILINSSKFRFLTLSCMVTMSYIHSIPQRPPVNNLSIPIPTSPKRNLSIPNCPIKIEIKRYVVVL